MTDTVTLTLKGNRPGFLKCQAELRRLLNEGFSPSEAFVMAGFKANGKLHREAVLRLALWEVAEMVPKSH